jgi:hypothetical protein
MSLSCCLLVLQEKDKLHSQFQIGDCTCLTLTLRNARILHDAAARPHHHFDEFAITLCRLIADKTTRTPLTIGVSGSWGSGKTTLLRDLVRPPFVIGPELYRWHR